MSNKNQFTFNGKKITCLEDVKREIKEDENFVYGKTCSGNDFCFVAACCGHLDTIIFLENEYNWDVKSTKSNYGTNVLMIASRHKYYDIVEYLCKKYVWDFTCENKFTKSVEYYCKYDPKLKQIIDESYSIENKVEKTINEYVASLENKVKELEEQLSQIKGIIC